MTDESVVLTDDDSTLNVNHEYGIDENIQCSKSRKQWRTILTLNASDATKVTSMHHALGQASTLFPVESSENMAFAQYMSGRQR